VREVCEWLEALGLGQYRRRFVHNAIDGRLLLALGDAELKARPEGGAWGRRCTSAHFPRRPPPRGRRRAREGRPGGRGPRQRRRAGRPLRQRAGGRRGHGRAPRAGIVQLGAERAAAAPASKASRPATARRPPQAELGVGPLGHRVALLRGIEELRAGASAFVDDLSARIGARRRDAPSGGGGGGGGGGPASRRPTSPGGGAAWPSPEADAGKRPRSAPNPRNRAPSASAAGGGAEALGPAAGRVTVEEQRAKLLFELSRAQARTRRALGSRATPTLRTQRGWACRRACDLLRPPPVAHTAPDDAPAHRRRAHPRNAPRPARPARRAPRAAPTRWPPSPRARRARWPPPCSTWSAATTSSRRRPEGH
jgi:hypothetical protein